MGNRAAAYIKKSEFEPAVEDCDAVLKMADISKDHRVKAMYRKGLALAGLGRHSAACEVLREAQVVDPSSPQVKQALESSEKMVKAALEKEAAEAPVKKAKKKIAIEEVDSSVKAEREEEDCH